MTRDTRQNQLAWLRVMERESRQDISPVQFRGLALTGVLPASRYIYLDIISIIYYLGWSRYDHFAVLCELLPVAVPSLVISLMVAR